CRVRISFLFFFFFSSRRRHTRFSRDWSSDVCSSDLAVIGTEQGGDLGADAEGVGPGVGGTVMETGTAAALVPSGIVVGDHEQGQIGRASCRERVEITGVGG